MGTLSPKQPLTGSRTGPLPAEEAEGELCKPREDVKVPSSPSIPPAFLRQGGHYFPEPELLPSRGKQHPTATLGQRLMNPP